MLENVSYYITAIQKFKYFVLCCINNMENKTVQAYEPVHEKNNNLHRRKQSRRSASR